MGASGRNSGAGAGWLRRLALATALAAAGGAAPGAAAEHINPEPKDTQHEYSWRLGNQCQLDFPTGGHWFNLGPTGARAMIAISEPRVFVVKYVFSDSPAYKKLNVEDKVVGANGKKFKEPEVFYTGYYGPRMELGKAIEESEGDPKLNGRLTLMVVREGKGMDVVIQLRQLGYFSKNFPFDCKKSELLVKDACEFLLKHWGSGSQPGGSFPGHWHTQVACTLALMAQGDTYKPLLKEHYKINAANNTTTGKPPALLQSILAHKKSAKAAELAALELLEAYVLKPVLAKVGELEALAARKDLYKLLEEMKASDLTYKGIAAYDAKSAPLKAALAAPDSPKLLEAGKAYYTRIAPLYETASGKVAQRGQVLKMTKAFIAAAPDEPYLSLAKERAGGLVAELNAALAEIVELKKKGDVYQASKRLAEADKEYGTLPAYVEKTAALKAELNTPANKALIKAGGLYYALEEHVKKNPGEAAQKRVAVFLRTNKGSYYGEKAQGLVVADAASGQKAKKEK